MRRGFIGILLVLLSSGTAFAGAPVIDSFSPFFTIKEAAAIRVSLGAHDPDGDALSYSWVMVDNPGNIAILEAAGSNSAFISLPAGPNFPNPSYQGEVIRVRGTVSDGVDSAEHIFELQVGGVNQIPVVIVKPNFEPNVPMETGDYIAFDATDSYDPDGTPVNFLWQVESIGPGLNGEGGRPISASLVINGHYSDYATLGVPRMSAPMSIKIHLHVADGLHVLSYSYTVYVQPAQEDPEPVPDIRDVFAAPAHARFGETVTLAAEMTQPSSDFTYSWVQSSTTGGPAVQLADPTARTTTFVAPSVDTVLDFVFTASNSAGQKDTSDVQVLVSEQGGTVVPLPPPDGGGDSPGVLVCGDAGNSPAVAQVPLALIVPSGNSFSVSAQNARDPDNSVNSFGITGVNFQWDVESGGGVLTNDNLSLRQNATVNVTAPKVEQDTQVGLSVLVVDATSCGTRYSVGITLQASSATEPDPDPDKPSDPEPEPEPNEPPAARLSYLMEDGESFQPVPDGGVEVEVIAPAVVFLDSGASSDPDGSVASHSFVLGQDAILSGSVLLASQGEGKRKLEIHAGTSGRLTLNVTVVDDQGASDSISMSFVITYRNLTPMPEVEITVDEEILEPGEVVEEGSVVTLDASQTRLEDGSQVAFHYDWQQTSGTPVSLVGDPSGSAFRFLASSPGGPETLAFRLVVHNQGFESDAVEVSVQVRIAPIFHPQIAVGRISDDEFFETVLVIANHNDVAADDIKIEFFDSLGNPLFQGGEESDLRVNGEVWSGDPISVLAESASVLRFSGQQIRQGWARIESDLRLDSQVLYRLVNEAGELHTEVPIFSATPRRTFVAPFDRSEGFAVAAVNLSDQPAEIDLKLVDEAQRSNGASPILLDPGLQTAFFVDSEELFSSVPDRGSLVVSSSGDIILTILKTKNGRVYSTVPMPNRRR